MTAHVSPKTHTVASLEYIDQWKVVEFVFELEGLCSRAGCRCIEGYLICNDFGYIYFNLMIYNWYVSTCYSKCDCATVAQGSPTAFGLRTGIGNVSADVFENSTRVAANSPSQNRS